MSITSCERPDREWIRLRMLKRLVCSLGGILFAVGLFGWYDRLVYGHLHANYGTVVPWGLGVTFYIYFIGLSAGAFLVSALVYVFEMKQFERIGRLAVFTALVTLVIALLSIWPDIGHMDRVWHIFAYPNVKSPMAVITWLYAAYFLLLLCELWFLLRRDLIAGAAAPGLQGLLWRLCSFGSRDVSEKSAIRDRRVVKALATVGIVMAIMFHGGVGTLFGVVVARPHWHSALYPIHFLLVALVSGGALLVFAGAIFGEGLRRNGETVLALGRIVLGLLLLDLLFQFSEWLIAFRGGIPGHTAGLALILGGPYWWIFWIWQVLLGTAVPLLLLVFPTRRDPRWVSLAGLLIATGYFALRLNIVIPGLAIEEIRGLSDAVASSRMVPSYFPSVSESLLSAWVIGFGLLVFGVGERLLPLAPKEESHGRV